MTGPYSAAARAYHAEGWSPIPLPSREKDPPPDGFTGANGAYVDELTLKRLLSAKGRANAGNMVWASASGNIALRMPRNVLGLDIDMYGTKAGRETLRAAEEAWGKLPDTWYSSARTDGSGIRLFTVPEGLAWPGDLRSRFGGGIELIRWDHRYAIVSPSVHPDTGEEYKWWRTDDASGPVEEFPGVAELPALAPAWVEGLTSGREWVGHESADITPKAGLRWLKARGGPDMCSAMRSTLTKWSQAVRLAGDDGGSHDSGRDGAWALIGDAQAGHTGVVKALAELRKPFMVAVARRSDERQASGEWQRIVLRGVAKVVAEGKPKDEDLCALFAHSGGNGDDAGGDSKGQHSGGLEGAGEQESWIATDGNGSSGSGHFDFSRDDYGNAMRLLRANMGVVKYVDYGSKGRWMYWDSNKYGWVRDTSAAGEIRRRFWAVTADMKREAEFIEDEKQKKEFLAFIKSTLKKGNTDAAISSAQAGSGITVEPTWFDSRSELLRSGRSVIELSPSGVAVKPSIPEQYLTLSTGGLYVPGASSPEWESFIESAQPDPEVRLWLQMLIGYSLRGGNSARLFAVCFGPTSTGKTTFMEILGAALGDYAGATNLTIFRDNQNDQARPDLLKVIPKRFVYAEEASSSWHLHADQAKRLTGGGTLTVRRMAADDYPDYHPQFTPWLVTNAVPTIEQADSAFWRRIRVVPWDVPIGVIDPDFLTFMRSDPDVLSGVLAWALAGWEAYAQGRGGKELLPPPGAFSALSRFRAGASDFDQFVSDWCVIDAGEWTPSADLRAAFEGWCRFQGVKVDDRFGSRKLGRFLSGLGFEEKAKWVDGKTVKGRRGIGLSSEAKTFVP